MTDTSNETEALITSIRTRSEGEEDAAQAIHLIRLIPYAGGAIASIISENASRRRTEKVCDVLSDLNARLHKHGGDPEKHLSKDQIVEFVHETLQTVATASDEKKIEALKAGLGYAFLSDDTFDRKQIFLKILRDCTSIELVLLPVLYRANDPYIVREPRPTTPTTGLLGLQNSSPLKLNNYGIPVASASDADILHGDWQAIGNRENCGTDPLLDFLSNRIGIDKATTEGAVRLLDSKGLSNAAPNLQRTDCKVFHWVESNASYLAQPSLTSSAVYSGGLINSFNPKPTPLEDSRRDFGREFLSVYC
jgi:hypothetical protein